jgi:hypothetical protein
MHRTVQLILMLFIFFPLGFLVYQQACSKEAPFCLDAKTSPAITTTDHDPVPTGLSTDILLPLPKQPCTRRINKTDREARRYLAPAGQDQSGEIALTSGQSSSLTMSVSVSGQIRYFSGQTNSLGQVMPVDPNRYLAGERMVILLDFNQEPGLIEIRMNNQSWFFGGFPGWLNYRTSLIIPDWPSTLSWEGERLAPPLSILVRAAAADDPGQVAEKTIEGIELTGHVRQIVRSQPAYP